MIRHVTLFILWLLLAMASKAAFANKSDSCEMRMLKIQEIRTIEAEDLQLGSQSQRMVKFESEMSFEFGGYLHLVRRTGSSWFSGYVTPGAGAEGDPRMFTLMFGAPVGYFFGYRQIADDLITVPDAAAMNAVMKILNENELKHDPLYLTFYEAEGIVPEKHYLDQNIKLLLPLSKMAHEHSFHTGMIGIPKADYEFAVEQIRWVHDFLKWVGPQMDRPWFKAFDRTLTEFLIIKMDQGAGSAPGDFSSRSVVGIGTSHPKFIEETGNNFEVFFSHGRAPDELLKVYAGYAFEELMQSGFPIEPRERILLNQKIEEFNQSRAKIPGRTDLQSSPENVQAYLKRLNERRKQIAEAVVKAKKRLNLPK